MTRDELARVLADVQDRKVATLSLNGYRHFILADNADVSETEYSLYRVWLLQAMNDSLVMETAETHAAGRVLRLTTLGDGWLRELRAEVAS